MERGLRCNPRTTCREWILLVGKWVHLRIFKGGRRKCFKTCDFWVFRQISARKFLTSVELAPRQNVYGSELKSFCILSGFDGRRKIRREEENYRVCFKGKLSLFLERGKFYLMIEKGFSAYNKATIGL